MAIIPTNKWTFVHKLGQAKLQFESDLSVISLKSGDYLLIPAHKKHRVQWTDPAIKTIWLAIHIFPATEPIA